MQRNNQKERKHAINNSLVKIPSRDFQFIHFLSPFFLVRANLPVVKPGDKQEPRSYHLVKRHGLAVRELDAEKKKNSLFSLRIHVTVMVTKCHDFSPS